MPAPRLSTAHVTGARLWGPILTALTLLASAQPAFGGLKIDSRIEVRTATSHDSLAAVTYLSGPWLRREIRGQGALSQMFGQNVQIVNRRTGATVTLYMDEKRYSRDSLGPQLCRPEAVVDLRFLGSVQSHAHVDVSLPDTTLRVLGVNAHPVQVHVRPKDPAREGTRIRIWVSSDFNTLFGSDYASDLACSRGDSGAVADATLRESWRRQFRLTDEDALLMAKGLVGYPVKIESLYGPDSAPISSTTVEMTRVEVGALPDSLFAPPAGFRQDLPESGNEGGADSSSSRRGGKR